MLLAEDKAQTATSCSCSCCIMTICCNMADGLYLPGLLPNTVLMLHRNGWGHPECLAGFHKRIRLPTASTPLGC